MMFVSKIKQIQVQNKLNVLPIRHYKNIFRQTHQIDLFFDRYE
jgi:hypothetical protein